MGKWGTRKEEVSLGPPKVRAAAWPCSPSQGTSAPALASFCHHWLPRSPKSTPWEGTCHLCLHRIERLILWVFCILGAKTKPQTLHLFTSSPLLLAQYPSRSSWSSVPSLYPQVVMVEMVTKILSLKIVWWVLTTIAQGECYDYPFYRWENWDSVKSTWSSRWVRVVSGQGLSRSRQLTDHPPSSLAEWRDGRKEVWLTKPH